MAYSRDEGKHAALRETYPEGPPGKVRYRIGDIRDLERLTEAMADCDTVIHAAALKRIDDCANHVQECVKTNVVGTANVLKACNTNGIVKGVFISTDKACQPISAYGTSKLMAEHLWIHANGVQLGSFAVCRYGNVIGSRGSVFHKWADIKKQQEWDHQHRRVNNTRIPVTDREMTRFFWHVPDAAHFAIHTMDHMQPGCVYVPKMASHRMWDIAKVYGDPVETGLRTAEKIHEVMVSEDEIDVAYDQLNRYCIYPKYHQWMDEQPIKGQVCTEPVTSENPQGVWEW